MSYINISVSKPGQNKGRGIKAQDRVIFFDMDDVLYFPPRDDKGVVITGNIIFKPNAYAITVYATSNTIEQQSNSEGDPDNEGFVQTLVFNHPGNEQQIREFKANWLGRNIGMLVIKCDSDYTDLYGDPCSPMRMQVAYTGNNESNQNVFTLTQTPKGDDTAIYKGTISLEEPLAIVPAGATSIALVGSGQYQLTGNDNAAVIIDVTGAAHDMVFTLLGATSDTPPTVETSSKFILKNGETWIGAEGKQITFRAFKSGNTDTDFVFIEQSRY